MKTTAAFLLHLLLHTLFLLIAPGGLITSALGLHCFATFVTKDHAYEHIGEASKIGYGQRSITKYVNPKQNLKVVLQVTGKEFNRYATEFWLEKEDCFKGDWPWWALFIGVKDVRPDTSEEQVKTTYEFQVRTSECVRQCNQIVNINRLNKLDIWASGASYWKDSHSNEHCGNIPHWKVGYSQDNFTQCTEVNVQELLAMTPSTTIATNATSTSTTATPTASATPTPSIGKPTASATATPSTACTFPLSVPVGVTGGVSAGALAVVVVVVAVVAVKLRQYRQTPVQGVAVRP